jgi:hypothetical protein
MNVSSTLKASGTLLNYTIAGEEEDLYLTFLIDYILITSAAIISGKEFLLM